MMTTYRTNVAAEHARRYRQSDTVDGARAPQFGGVRQRLNL